MPIPLLSSGLIDAIKHLLLIFLVKLYFNFIP